jgi:hypothetical protein
MTCWGTPRDLAARTSFSWKNDARGTSAPSRSAARRATSRSISRRPASGAVVTSSPGRSTSSPMAPG